MLTFLSSFFFCLLTTLPSVGFFGSFYGFCCFFYCFFYSKAITKSNNIPYDKRNPVEEQLALQYKMEVPIYSSRTYWRKHARSARSPSSQERLQEMNNDVAHSSGQEVSWQWRSQEDKIALTSSGIQQQDGTCSQLHPSFLDRGGGSPRPKAFE